MATQAETLAQLVAQVAALQTALTDALAAKALPASPTAGTHVGPSGKLDGREHACSAPDACGRVFRSTEHASVHGVDAGGHAPRTAAKQAAIDAAKK